MKCSSWRLRSSDLHRGSNSWLADEAK